MIIKRMLEIEVTPNELAELYLKMTDEQREEFIKTIEGEISTPKKLSKKQEIALGAERLRQKWERRDRLEAEKEYPIYLEEARKKLKR